MIAHSKFTDNVAKYVIYYKVVPHGYHRLYTVYLLKASFCLPIVVELRFNFLQSMPTFLLDYAFDSC